MTRSYVFWNPFWERQEEEEEEEEVFPAFY